MALSMRKKRQLMPGEDPARADFVTARGWLTIYEQRQALLAISPGVDAREAEAILDGVAFWKEQLNQLSGLGLDSDRRVLMVDGETQVQLTRRELQLLEFLLQHPERYFADHVLAVRAWGDRLSGDQVRIYVRRLRLKLAPTGWELVSRRGQGYALKRSNPQPRARADGRAAPSLPAVGQAIARAHALLGHQQLQIERAAAAAATLRSILDSAAPPV
jgi:DNA-binding winged helix-turn-helix (wHTH) protein